MTTEVLKNCFFHSGKQRPHLESINLVFVMYYMSVYDICNRWICNISAIVSQEYRRTLLLNVDLNTAILAMLTILTCRLCLSIFWSLKTLYWFFTENIMLIRKKLFLECLFEL